jgi:catechol 1,2-dioxygenase
MPLGALLDVWQADAGGHYDNDGHLGRIEPIRLRGKLVASSRGEYEIETILPGHYLNGPQYRPAHVHVKVSAPGHRPLTTQLYFEGDPYNAIDPFIRPELVMKLEDESGGKGARFDFVLAMA